MARGVKSKRKTNSAVAKQNSKIPVSVIVFLVWTGLSCISFLTNMLSTRTIIAGLFLTGILAILVNLILAAAQGFIFFGTIKRRSWARPLIIIFYAFLLIQLIISLISFQLNSDAYINFSLANSPILSDPTLSGVIHIAAFISLLASFIFNLVISILIFIMLKRRKEYFSK